MALVRTEGLVIKKFDYGETSLVVRFYTKDYGKINLIFKGIKSEPQKFFSSLEVFSYNEIIFYKNKNTSLHLASQCDLKENFDPIRNNLDKISFASVIMELLDVVMPLEDKNEEVFTLSFDSLKAICEYQYPDKIITIFKIKILSLCGFKPHLDSCIICQEKISSQARFSVNLGGLICSNCQKKDIKARPVYRGTVATILHIEKNNLANNLNLGINPQIKRELDYILDTFFEFHLEKKLKSEKLAIDLTGKI
ncbi:MAG: DNA repair protein RecO [Candidatus Omnitrophica bacterium]|nr:DNA repair protein RecO [Candidatus Omnitrophota bacterium]